MEGQKKPVALFAKKSGKGKLGLSLKDSGNPVTRQDVLDFDSGSTGALTSKVNLRSSGNAVSGRALINALSRNGSARSLLDSMLSTISSRRALTLTQANEPQGDFGMDKNKVAEIHPFKQSEGGDIEIALEAFKPKTLGSTSQGPMVPGVGMRRNLLEELGRDRSGLGNFRAWLGPPERIPVVAPPGGEPPGGVPPAVAPPVDLPRPGLFVPVGDQRPPGVATALRDIQAVQPGIPEWVLAEPPLQTELEKNYIRAQLNVRDPRYGPQLITTEGRKLETAPGGIRLVSMKREPVPDSRLLKNILVKPEDVMGQGPDKVDFAPLDRYHSGTQDVMEPPITRTSVEAFGNNQTLHTRTLVEEARRSNEKGRTFKVTSGMGGRAVKVSTIRSMGSLPEKY